MIQLKNFTENIAEKVSKGEQIKVNEEVQVAVNENRPIAKNMVAYGDSVEYKVDAKLEMFKRAFRNKYAKHIEDETLTLYANNITVETIRDLVEEYRYNKIKNNDYIFPRFIQIIEEATDELVVLEATELLNTGNEAIALYELTDNVG